MTKIHAISSALSQKLRSHLSAIKRGLALLVVAFLVLFLLSVLDHAVGYLVSRKPQGLVAQIPQSKLLAILLALSFTLSLRNFDLLLRNAACSMSMMGISLKEAIKSTLTS